MCSAVSYEWRPIENLSEDWEALELPHLHSIAQLWRKRREEERQAFEERLKREWAVETGILEHLYTLDEAAARLLIERGIHADYIGSASTDKAPEAVALLIGAQQEALENICAFVKDDRELDTAYIKELHTLLTRHQEEVTTVDAQGNIVRTSMLRGEWKERPNSPARPDGKLYLYCPPAHTAEEMDRLMEMHRKHRAEGVPPEVEAAFLHHRFTQIHPFQDGNGRVARCLASLEYLRAGFLPPVVPSARRKEYVQALGKADQGEFALLVVFLGGCVENALTAAMGHREHAAETPPEEAARRFAEMLALKKLQDSDAEKRLAAHSEALLTAARKRLRDVEYELTNALRERGFFGAADNAAPRGTDSARPVKLTSGVVMLQDASAWLYNDHFLVWPDREAGRLAVCLHAGHAALAAPEPFVITSGDALEDLIPLFHTWLDKTLVRLFEILQERI